MEWFIGCSGFYYKDWKILFYPEKLAQKRWFEYYCMHFNTLELNTTFYRFPRVEFLQQWYERSPAGFSFAVKIPRLITHYKKLNDCAALLNDFYTTVGNGLMEKLSVVLFQLPSVIQYSDANLEKVIRSVNKHYLNVYEFRHVSWWRESVYRALSDNNIVFCNISHPSLPSYLVFNTPVTYVRMHGVPVLYGSSYRKQTLKTLVNQVGTQTEKAYIYFNNTANTAAVENALFTMNYAGIKIENPLLS